MVEMIDIEFHNMKRNRGMFKPTYIGILAVKPVLAAKLANDRPVRCTALSKYNYERQVIKLRWGPIPPAHCSKPFVMAKLTLHLHI